MTPCNEATGQITEVSTKVAALKLTACQEAGPNAMLSAEFDPRTASLQPMGSLRRRVRRVELRMPAALGRSGL